jgi:hypothetical protein
MRAIHVAIIMLRIYQYLGLSSIVIVIAHPAGPAPMMSL